MTDPPYVYARLSQIVASMSLAAYQGQTQELTDTEVWDAMDAGCSAIADLAERVTQEDDVQA